MNKTMLAAAIAALGMVALVAQGVEIEKNVDENHNVPMPGNQATEICHIFLTSGTWDVSGTANFWELNEQGTLFVGANIGVGHIFVSNDGFTGFQSGQLDSPDNLILNVALPSRIVKAPPNGINVYLVGFSNQPGQPAPNCVAWGFISARLLHP